jgi:hypothetical protein
VQDKLLGNDVPGTFVKLTVLSHDLGTQKEIMLTRMATSAIADNVRMFEIFTALKVSFSAPLACIHNYYLQGHNI